VKPKSRNTRIAFFCGPDRKFLPDIVEHFSNRTDEYEIQIFNSKEVNDFTDLMAWSDISWFEWCDSLVIEATKLPKVCRIVCRLHRYEAFTGMPPRVKWSNVDTLILVANHMKDALKMRLPDIEDQVNIKVMYNGVNPEKFVYKKRQNGYNIAYIGYLNYRKNPSLLLLSMKALVDKDPRYKLHIAGSFQDKECKLYMEQMIEQLDLKDNVIFYGWIDDLDAWMDNKSYILSTCIHEGCPCGIMEAMATGLKPLIHNFYAAEELYPRNYLFSTIDEFVQMVLSDDFDSDEYRKYIEEHFPLKRQLNQIDSEFKRLWAMDAEVYPPSLRSGTVMRHNVLMTFLADKLETGQKLLDVGGFDGVISSSLKANIGVEPVVLDTDPAGLEIAEKRGLETCQTDATNIPYPDSSFHAALCLDVLEHVSNDAVVLEQMHRILKPKGLLILTVPVADAKFVSLTEEGTEKLHELWFHDRPGYKINQLRSMLERLNFQIESTTGYCNAECREMYVHLHIRKNIIPEKKRAIIWDSMTRDLTPSDGDNMEHLIVARKL